MLTLGQPFLKLAISANIFVFGAMAPETTYADSKKKIRSPLAFDISTRKKTKGEVNRWLKYSGSVGVSYLSERNLKLDDGVQDRSDQREIIAGLAARARLSPNLTVFAHLEFAVRHKKTHNRTYAIVVDILAKEVLISARISDKTTLSFGRLRFSDRNKWVVDKAVNGIHFGYRGDEKAFEFAVFKDDDNDSTYALTHYLHYEKNYSAGVFAIVERARDETLFHLTGYLNNQKNDRFGYSFNIAGLAGNRVSAASGGFGVDFSATRKITRHKWQPQLNFGLAFGSKGFRQTGLQSNKTKKGGQVSSNQYGYVYQPELTNIAVVSVGIGLRPNRKFSMDLNAFAYAQINKLATIPLARISGSTNGTSAYLGAEVSLIGAWRPSKKTKVAFGAGVFKPGPAYMNQPTTKRLYLRVTRYF